MRINELIESYEDLQEGGKSGGIRYNSEVGMLVGMLGIDPATFDPKKPEAALGHSPIDNAPKVYAEIKKFLAPDFDSEMFTKWADKGKAYIAYIAEKLGTNAFNLGWAGGTNKNEGGVADVSFSGVNCSGVSIKAEGGITLANLTPKALGLTPEKGTDLFYQYAQQEYEAMKRTVFGKVLKAAAAQPGVPLDPMGLGKYTITYDPNTTKYKCAGKKNFEGTESEIMNACVKNATWQRVFGDWFQKNYAANKMDASDLYAKLAKVFEEMVSAHLANSGELLKILQFAEVPYFYASSSGLYYVPDKSAVSDLQVKGFSYGRISDDEDNPAKQPEGTAQLFTAKIGKADSKTNAEIDIYIRYANGMFACNPTVRVQNLRNPQFMSWEKLV